MSYNRSMATTYGRTSGSRTNHIVRGTATACGKPTTGMATWPASMGSRVAHAPLCESCRTAARRA